MCDFTNQEMNKEIVSPYNYKNKLCLDARKPVFKDLRKTKAQTSLHTMQMEQCLCFSFCKRYISRLAISEISIFYLVPDAEETGLRVALLEIPKTGFVVLRAKRNLS